MKKIISLSLALVVFSTLIQSQVNLDSGLVAYYPLEGSAVDYSSYAILGVVHGATLDIGKNGYSNSAYNFNGINQYIDCDTNQRGITEKVTASVWIRKTTMNNSGQVVVTKYRGGSGTIQQGFQLSINPGGHPRFAGRLGQSSTSGFYQIIADEKIVTDGSWHHLLGTVDQNEWNFWVDGDHIGTVIGNSLSPSLVNPDILAIGFYPEIQGFYFDGTIDEVKVYNRVLNSNEINLLSDISFIDTTYMFISELEYSEYPILYQNFPNPFTSETEFRFYLPEKTNCELAVYNSFGEKISVLANGLMEKGDHILKFNSRGLSAGTYYYQILSNSFTQTRKMVIIK
ncbi:MAG: T9SS type A sorting domain-containing protein [Bacteroidales bacterium]|nr:T9SS type A sorting domain-containing protein [Bacteroidales bacterium]MCF8457423.1 T9SS type A sorting domain-containing protein [Bacteroidales bacterium]